MLDRLQKPFLTVESGEAYQPIRLKYQIKQKDSLITLLNQLKCCKKSSTPQSWDWFWCHETDELHFESIDTFKKDLKHPLRLATLTIHDGALYINLPSFKRACLALPFFHRIINQNIAKVQHADFVNKVFGLDEPLPHGFSELFDEAKLQQIVLQRIEDFQATEAKCERAASADEAFQILDQYLQHESHKSLPYAERYLFEESQSDDPDVIYLGFYIYLRSRELVATRRWFGKDQYTLADAAEETLEKVFGGMNIDIIE